jgi:3-hydroxyisobutyrate dehydrogenase-like beta-hydroxyacid dehydrogenase
VDAPVSGGPADALAGSLTLLIGAEAEALNRARPVLAQLGSIEHVGPPGHGKAAKLVNNTMTMGNMVVAAEAFTLGVKLGLDPDALFDVLSRSGGRSHHFVKRMPLALARDFTARFALYLSEKDLRLALEMGHDVSYAMPVASTVHQIYELARAKGLADEDMVAVIKVYEEWAQTQAASRASDSD